MSSGYVVAVLAIVCSGSVAHGIVRKEDVISVGLYFSADEDLNLVVCQACNNKVCAQR